MPDQSGDVEKKRRVLAGVAAFIIQPWSDPKNPAFIVGERMGSHGAGALGLPGGHMENGDTPQSCTIREVLEETGLEMDNARSLTYTNDRFDEEKQYITLFMVCVQHDNMKPKVLEQDKCKGWEYMTWNDMVECVENGGGRELFLPLINLVKQRPGLIPNEEWIKRTPAEDLYSMI